jgi:hypothetical protein
MYFHLTTKFRMLEAFLINGKHLLRQDFR